MRNAGFNRATSEMGTIGTTLMQFVHSKYGRRCGVTTPQLPRQLNLYAFCDCGGWSIHQKNPSRHEDQGDDESQA